MDTLNLQSVVKAASPKASSVAIASEVAVKEDKSVNSGKVLSLENRLESVINEPTQPLLAKDKVEKTVSELNSFVQNIQRGIQFSVHEETGRSVITVTDKETGDEIRKFPSDQLLIIAEHLAEQLAVPNERGVGLLVNGKA